MAEPIPIYTVASDSETTGEERTSSPSVEIAIGIDIGTMHLRASIWNGSDLEVLTNRKNQKSMECFLSSKTEGYASGLMGNTSLEREMQSGSAIFNLKRLIGRNDKDPIIQASKCLPFLVQTVDIGVRPLIGALVNNVWRYTTPEEVLAILLAELKSMAEAQFKRPVRSAVLTVPVCFSRFQVTRVSRACAMAGLHVLRLMPEPTALALLYAQQQLVAMHDNLSSSGSEKIALVFNMGAGYCDVAVTATSGGVSQIRALAGSAVGGEDILMNTLRHVIPDFDGRSVSSAYKDVKLLAAARSTIQRAIHALSTTSHVEVNVDVGDGVVISQTLDRDVFEDVNKEVFAECLSLMKQCLCDAKVKAEDLADVILVGGCSFIPKIRNLVKDMCKKEELYEGIDPLEAAVCGAALEGAVASGINDPFGKLELLTIQATPMTIGIQADRNRFVPIIPRNTITPARREMVFTTAHDNQTEALILVYEGEGADIVENHLLGFFKVDVPEMPKGVPEIKVCMDIDATNVLRVLAGVTLRGSNQPVGPLIEVRVPNIESGQGWCAEALTMTCESASLALMTLPKNGQP